MHALVDESLGVPREEEPLGLEQGRVALHQPALRGLVEIDHHVPAEDRVQPGLDRPLAVHQVHAHEFDVGGELAAHARLALEAPAAAHEEALLALGVELLHRGERIDGLARRGQDLGVEVARDDAEGVSRNRLGEAHRDRVGLLARGAARAPYAQGLARDGARACVLGEDREVVRLAVEGGHVGGERVGAVLPLGGLELEELHVVVERGDAERAQPAREARIDHLALALREPDAGEAIDALADQAEVLRAERELARVGRSHHAAARARGRDAVVRVMVATSRIRATRPSPRMVAPATPGTAWRLVSSDFTTSCCWPTRLSTRSAARRLSTSTTRHSGSGGAGSLAGSLTTSSRRTIGSCSPRTATSEARFTMVRMSFGPGLKASATNSSGMMYCSPPTLTIIPSRTARVSGTWIAITVPSPFTVEIDTLPPRDAILRRTTSMPTPRPERLVTSLAVEKPASKTSPHASWSLMDSSAAMPSSRPLAMMRSRSRPRPSSEISMMTLPPRWVARMPTVPISGLPAARRSSGLSMPWSMAFLTTCVSGSTRSSISSLSSSVSRPWVRRFTFLPSLAETS